MADQSFLGEDNETVVTDETEGLIDLNGDRENYNSIIGTVKARFSGAETGRRNDETRWLKSYKNYRGIYDSTTQYRDNERSQVFIKITKTKVLAAYGQIIDILSTRSYASDTNAGEATAGTASSRTWRTSR